VLLSGLGGGTGGPSATHSNAHIHANVACLPHPHPGLSDAHPHPALAHPLPHRYIHLHRLPHRNRLSNGDLHALPPCYGNAIFHPDPLADPYAIALTDAHPHPHLHSHPLAYSHPLAHLDCDSHGNTYA